MTHMTDKNNESARFALVAMLRRCADYLSTLPPDDIDALLDGELELRLSVVTKKRKAKKKSSPSKDSEQLANIVTSSAPWIIAQMASNSYMNLLLRVRRWNRLHGIWTSQFAATTA